MSIRLSSFSNHRKKLCLSLYNYKEGAEYDDYYTLRNSSRINALSYSVLELGHGSGMLLSWYICSNNTKLSNYEYDNARYRFRVNENGNMEKRSSDCLSANSDEWGSYYYAHDKQMMNKNRGE